MKKWGLILIAFITFQLNAQESKVKTSNEFKAFGNSDPNSIGEKNKVGEVVVTFEEIPTELSFDLPAFPCMVMENGFKYSNFWAETYDPREWRAQGGMASFETLMDRNNKYARMWIEQQSDARILVRVRGALCNIEEDIAHADFESKSPYGDGDWVDEWFYIYPDGVHTRYVKIYTGLADRSRPFGFDRDPPKVVHEFMESAVIGKPGYYPVDMIDTNAITVIRLIGDNVNQLITEGESKTISYVPYPDDFGQFRDANIWVVNMKSEYKPFVIGMPYGSRVQPYSAEDDLPYVFQTWGDPPDGDYSCGLGHMLNYWHFKRNEHSIEQVYLQGMTNVENTQEQLVSLAWSWIASFILYTEKDESERQQSYDVIYKHEQRAYLVPKKEIGPELIEFTLEPDWDIEDFGAGNWLINPAFVLENWGASGVRLEVNDEEIKPGKNFKVGYEKTSDGTDLVLWVRLKTSESTKFKLIPKK